MKDHIEQSFVRLKLAGIIKTEAPSIANTSEDIGAASSSLESSRPKQLSVEVSDMHYSRLKLAGIIKTEAPRRALRPARKAPASSSLESSRPKREHED